MVAQWLSSELDDDITGEEAQETVPFGLDGMSYDIDLTTDNATKLRHALNSYLEKGRQIQRRGSGRPRRTSTSTASGRREKV